MRPSVDPELATLIPPLAAEEFAGLRESLLAEGCRNPLVVWAETGILLDGHTRLAICEAEGIEYQTTEVSLPDREAAMSWVIANQLARRNLHPDAASLLRGRLYNMRKQKRGGTGANRYTEQTCHNDRSVGLTADCLSTELGISPRTIARDGAFAQAVEALRPIEPDLERDIMSGSGPSRKAVIQAAESVEKKGVYQPVAVTVFSSRSEEYYTPAPIVEAAREVLGGIDLDPASCDMAQETVRAGRYYTKADDGLSRAWAGKVFINPPYGTTAGQSNQGIWAARAVDDYKEGRIEACILLVKAALGYEWFEELWYAWPVCFPRQRLSFRFPDGSDDGQSKQASALVYLGPSVGTFTSVFRRFGRVIMPEEAP